MVNTVLGKGTPMATPLTAHDRCDRCGAQAYYVTAHGPTSMMWCNHHYRKNEAHLAPNLIHMEPIDKQPTQEPVAT